MLGVMLGRGWRSWAVVVFSGSLDISVVEGVED